MPLPLKLDKHAFSAIGAAAFFDDTRVEALLDGWVQARGLAVGEARGRVQGAAGSEPGK
ncbi:MAG: hypothetical protein IT373_34820 [Polyangiaceae bacterium]|nr:hypothetical protein [Polyangiaceae bacterium]